MRLFDTYTKSLVELPPPPAPVRMYFCGPTVYARAHIGNARPFVVGMWLRTWLRMRGYEVTLVHNTTDVNEKIYDAAPGATPQLALGARPAGVAHRVLGARGGVPRPELRDPRRRPRPRLPPPRERARAVTFARASVRTHLDAQRDAALHRREDVEVGRQRRDDPR